jgi:hypothetical protein
VGTGGQPAAVIASAAVVLAWLGRSHAFIGKINPSRFVLGWAGLLLACLPLQLRCRT